MELWISLEIGAFRHVVAAATAHGSTPSMRRMSTKSVLSNDPLTAWQDAISPQLGVCRAFLVGRSWQRLAEGKMADSWTRLLRRADCLSRVAYVSEHDEQLGEPGGFVQALTLAQLPGYFTKLIGPYELRACWFEVAECVRKIALIGLPVFLMPGTLEQLIIGLFICFVSSCFYMLFSPYQELKHDYVSRLCQATIFFALLSGVVLKADPSDATIANLNGVLMLFAVVPPFLALAFMVHAET